MASATETSTTSGFTDQNGHGTQVDWTSQPGQLSVYMGFYAEGTVTDTMGNCTDQNHPPPYYGFMGVTITSPQPAGGYGTVPISHSNITNFTHNYYSCGGVGTTPHISGSITISQPSDNNPGSNDPAGTANGNSSTTASGNGTVNVGSSSCAGPGN